MDGAARLLVNRGPGLGSDFHLRKATRFLGGSFLTSVGLLAAGVEVASVPKMGAAGVLLLLCALEVAFLMPFLWNRMFRDA